ncbi:UDP-N-acetylglucosamine 2-epimerase (non-hydrolyzing) [Vibrio sp. V09_P4A23P171]|uniref:non-hydrolyzing UDP-N-acetylglucosamine 2-epimerase n=1 Tax=Vibrio sp. V09_P4A23P171 TaxID=1938664 RepID=UPI000B8E3B4A|nr:UDP-N-acetylglucosamine 2-epimerase (non-hydrolyzing) [Vibrio sp. V09_P4A23P171]OXX36950.1 UDP-N-acetylglucosamine 2-epimerase (non-hydrolyzing) [Vibrio sp. V09_P4A23P171]
MKRVLVVFGTRPEAIKMAPLVHCLKQSGSLEVQVCTTGQHREMLDQVLKLFKIKPDFDLDLMQSKQTLVDVTARILTSVSDVLSQIKPDIVLVHGDTATTFSVTLASYYQKIPVGHIEAGLRTGDIYSPWPEEANRKLTSVLSTLNFAPTYSAQQNLLLEGVPCEKVFVTGNTVIDALLHTKDLIGNSDSALSKSLTREFSFLSPNKKTILLTTHRRENFGSGIVNICRAVNQLTNQRSDIQFIMPVHPNPQVSQPIYELLSNNDSVHLIEPLEYTSFVYAMDLSYLILTDSGGIQEEAPSLGKPVLVLRDTTERPEAVSAGTVKLVGTNVFNIVSQVNNLLDDESLYSTFSNKVNPFGVGESAKKIVSILEGYFK